MLKATEERTYWLAWSQIPGVGPVILKRIKQHFGTLIEAWNASEKALAEIEGLGNKSLAAVVAERARLVPEKLLEQHQGKNPNFWTPADPEYPTLLWEIPSPPPVLYYRGQANLLENQGTAPLIGIVGTRYPTEHGRRWTRKIATALTREGFGIVSGMAAGIDGEAHHSCLKAGGRTLAVLGTDVDSVYPANHRQLHQQIRRQGLILSEYPAETKPERGNFPARNRIIAGLSRAVLIVEAPEKSGALITARYANEFGRDVFTLPNSPDVEEARGCLRLIHQGAEIVVQIEELLAALGGIPPLDGKKNPSPSAAKAVKDSYPPPPPDLEPHLARVLQAIAAEPTPFDAIVQEAQLSAGEVSASLLQLELLGLICQLPGMRYHCQ